MKKTHQVYTIVNVDKNGKAEMDFTELENIEIGKGLTLGQYIKNNEEEKQELREKVTFLENKIKVITDHFNEFRNATMESFETVIDEMNKEKFL